MENKKYKILLATGGTGGHIFPALALKEHLLEQGFETILTSDEKYKNYLIPDNKTYIIHSSSFANKTIKGLFNACFCNFLGLFSSIKLLIKYKPDLVYGFGGYATFPVMLAAKLLNIKIALHEANTVMGKVNKIFIKDAQFISCGFKEIKNISIKNKIFYTGNPLRRNVEQVQKDHYSPETLKILVIGGSQGAKIFSKFVTDALINLPQNVKNNIQVFQQVREEDIKNVQEKYLCKNIKCEIKSFFNNINDYYQKSDLVIARSGASTVSELIALKMPAILIPLPTSADNHQYFNALYLADNQAAILLKENISATIELSRIINKIFIDREQLVKMQDKLNLLQTDPLKMIQTLILEKIN